MHDRAQMHVDLRRDAREILSDLGVRVRSDHILGWRADHLAWLDMWLEMLSGCTCAVDRLLTERVL